MTSDRLRAFIDVIIASVDDRTSGEELARRCFLSRFHFDRLVSSALGESPGAFRRRLLLERAAYELRDGSVTAVAVAAGYGSPEAFAHAFKRAFGTAPSEHGGDFRLPAPNGIHFHPPGGLLVPGDDSRRHAVDLTERLVEHNNWLTGRLIDTAEQLPDADLDQPVPLDPPSNAFFEEQPSIRSMLDRLVFTKEMWSAAIAGKPAPEQRDTSFDGLRRRLHEAGAEFSELVRGIRDRQAWDTAFVDATCDPPETFTFGGAVAHVVTWDSYRRQVLIGALVERGADVSGLGDPIHWDG